MTSKLLALAAVAAAAATPALAHHSGAMFERVKETTVTGVIKEIQWTNPHAWIELQVSGPKGTSTQWGVEFGGGPQTLLRTGFTRSNPKVGDKVTVVMHPLKDGRPGGSFMRLITADGRTLGSEAPGAASGAAPPVPGSVPPVAGSPQ